MSFGFQPRILKRGKYDRFYKSNKARAGGGTGLGLSISREVLGMMGETIKV